MEMRMSLHSGSEIPFMAQKFYVFSFGFSMEGKRTKKNVEECEFSHPFFHNDLSSGTVHTEYDLDFPSTCNHPTFPGRGPHYGLCQDIRCIGFSEHLR
jgi:hypothetical protein